MTEQTMTHELTHLLRNMDSLVRMRLVLGDTEENVAQALRERGADDYLIDLLVPRRLGTKSLQQTTEESKRLVMRANAAVWELRVHREIQRTLVAKQRALRTEVRKKLSN